jgi:hypothetical protein
MPRAAADVFDYDDGLAMKPLSNWLRSLLYLAAILAIATAVYVSVSLRGPS